MGCRATHKQIYCNSVWSRDRIEAVWIDGGFAEEGDDWSSSGLRVWGVR